MKRIFATIVMVSAMMVFIPAATFASTDCDHVWMTGSCQECGEVCDHVWDVDDIEFCWGEDCHAASTCTICELAIEKLCTVSVERIEPTCTSDGKFIKTAVVEIDGEEYTEQVSSPIDAVDHEYENDACIHCGDVYIFLDKPVLKTSLSASGLKVSWEKVKKADRYLLYRKVTHQWEKVADLSASKTSYVDKDIVPEGVFYYKLMAVTEVDGERFESGYSEQVKRTVSKIYAPATVKAERAGYKSVRVSWSRVYPATGYEIYRSTTGKDGSFKRVMTIKKNNTLSWKDTGLTTGKKYYYKVRAYYGSDVNYRVRGTLSTPKSATPNLSKPVMKAAVNATGSTIKVSWKKVSYANGYTVYRKTTSGSWKNVGSVKGNKTFSFKDVPKVGVYLYSVKAYRTVNGKKVYSLRSDAIQTRTLKAPTVTVKAVDDEFKQKVTWTKITGATEYQIWRKDGSGSWKLATTKKSSATRAFTASVPHGKVINWKVRAIYKKGATTTYSSYSKIKSYIISYEPYYSVKVPSASKSKMQYITISITNMGDYKMKILKEGAILNPEDESTARETVLVNSSTNKTMSSLTIDPGTTKKVKMKVVDGTMKYNKYYMVGFTFRYDGQDFVGVSSAYYGSYYQNVEL